MNVKFLWKEAWIQSLQISWIGETSKYSFTVVLWASRILAFWNAILVKQNPLVIMATNSGGEICCWFLAVYPSINLLKNNMHQSYSNCHFWELFFCSTHCAKLFAYNFSLIPLCNTVRWVLLSQFSRQRTWGSDRLSTLIKVMQIISKSWTSKGVILSYLLNFCLAPRAVERGNHRTGVTPHETLAWVRL